MAYTTIDNPELYFQTKLYTGTGSSNSITLDGSENMQPDWVWIKRRNGTNWHTLYDSVRGTTKVLNSNEDEPESTDSTGLTSFDSDGFTHGSGGNGNIDGGSFVAWNWKKTAAAGFDIVSFTGSGSARTISHSLSAVPKFYLVKNRSTDNLSWRTYHTSIGATKFMALEHTYAEASASSVFNNTEPTSSVFSVGTDDGANKNGDNLICYLFSEVKGYSKFGSYTGNGNADGTFVYTGFKPAWILLKASNNASWNWRLSDSTRTTFNSSTHHNLFPSSNDAEVSNEKDLDYLSNGFKLRTSGSGVNASGYEMIYMAFAESPLVNSNGIPNNAR